MHLKFKEKKFLMIFLHDFCKGGDRNDLSFPNSNRKFRVNKTENVLVLSFSKMLVRNKTTQNLKLSKLKSVHKFFESSTSNFSLNFSSFLGFFFVIYKWYIFIYVIYRNRYIFVNWIEPKLEIFQKTYLILKYLLEVSQRVSQL